MFSQRIYFSKSEGGQGLAEYSLIISLVAIVVVMILALFGEALTDSYCHIIYEITPWAEPPSTCASPIASLKIIDQGPTTINIEAQVDDPDGDPLDPYGAIDRVEFYMDSIGTGYVRTEYHYRYCLSGNPGGMPCDNYNISGLSPGQHTVIVLAYDTDGNVGKAQVNFTK